jgi:hypothetical protein
MQLLLLFALLQCVAPLAHAHVNGHNADHGIHLFYTVHTDSDSQIPGLLQLSAETDSVTVVSMPPQYKSVELTVVQTVGLVNEPLFALREYEIQQFVILPRQILPFLPYQHPCSRAPPA